MAGPRLRDLPAEDRPRERLLRQGVGVLSDAELLAVLLRTGVTGLSAVALGQRLMTERGGIVGVARMSPQELAGVHGFGEAKACQIAAALELGRRVAQRQAQQRPEVDSPEKVHALLGEEMAALQQEELRVLLLTVRNGLLGVRTVHRGTVSEAPARAAEVLREAVRENAPRIIVVHNHPSGDPSPSPQDLSVTRRLVRAGRELDIEVLDHVILAARGFRSLRDDGRVSFDPPA